QVEADISKHRRQSAGVLHRRTAGATGACDLSPGVHAACGTRAVASVGGRTRSRKAVKQMANACALPVAVAGALMPDAHVGYGLPIGGVLATEGAVVPYAVGVDIACRMMITVFDLPPERLAMDRDRFENILERITHLVTGYGY